MQPGFLKPRFAAALATLLALGCGGDPEQAAGVERAAIVNGEISDDDPTVVNFVARISDIATQTCSGTLIAPNVVLTALHCVTYRENPDATFNCRTDGSIVPGMEGAGSLGLPIAGENVQVYLGSAIGTQPDATGVRVFGTGSTQICRDDLAVVVIDNEIGSGVSAMRFAGRSVTVGEDMIAVGYGEDADGMIGDRHRRAVQVLDVGDVGSVDGTGPTAPNTFVVGEGPCQGDSGGPTLSAETGAVVGVYSLTLNASSCTSVGVRNTYTLLSQYEDTIREALEYAGHEPVIEEGSAGTSGTGGTSGNAGNGGTTGEGSGSRDDPACTCRAAGARTNGAFGWGALGLAVFAALRRRRRH